MEITPTIKAILLSVSGRSQKYWTFWLSRHEWSKYDTTQDKLRYIIKKLKQEWYITLEGYEPNPSFKANPVRAVYKATEKLFDLVKSFTKKIVDLNDKIVRWCSEQNPLDTIRQHDIQVFGKRIGKKNSNVTVSQKWCISDWRTWEKWNLFDFLRKESGQWVLEFYYNFVW